MTIPKCGVRVGPRSPKLLVAVLTMLWIIGIALASMRTDVSAQSASERRSNADIAELNRAFVRQVMQAAQAQAPGRGQGQVPGQWSVDTVFKNVQKLKGISIDEFIDTMGIMANSLSFCCNDCHT